MKGAGDLADDFLNMDDGINHHLSSIERMMDERRCSAYDKFGVIVKSHFFIDGILRCLCEAYLEENEHALFVLNNLGFDELDVYSVLELQDYFEKRFFELYDGSGDR